MEKNKINIPVFFTFDNSYVLPALVAINSLLKNASSEYNYFLYIVHSRLSDTNIERLKSIVNKYSYKAEIFFILVSSCDESWNLLHSKQHYSKEIYNKLIAPILFPQYDRIICSDVDVVFLGDISPSYFLFDDDFYVAGVKDIFVPGILDWYVEFEEEEKTKLYEGIGAGYLLLNLKKMRLDNKHVEMINCYQENLFRLIQPEQDVINLCCYPYIEYLPFEYLVCTGDYLSLKKNIAFRREVLNPERILEDALSHPIQLHYSGFIKPWNSFFSLKQKIWLTELLGTGYFMFFLKMFPCFLFQRCKKYNIKRFVHKIFDKFFK